MNLSALTAVIVTALYAINHELLLIAAALDGWGQ